MAKKWYLATVLVFLLLASAATSAFAHGVNISYQVNLEVEIVAEYATGEPMSGAQVTVFAPDAATSPWSVGACDVEGRFTFMPDPLKTGTWVVQVRSNGHSRRVYIPIGVEGATSGVGTTLAGSAAIYPPQSGTASEPARGHSVFQTVLPVVGMLWGLLGTVLFFRRKRKKA